jgi:cathepsin L
VLVGYGTDAATGLDYYLVRNSWSAGWGEDGYIRVARYGDSAAGEPCLTDNTPGDGDGCRGGPPKIQVCGLCGILSDSSYPTGASLA